MGNMQCQDLCIAHPFKNHKSQNIKAGMICNQSFIQQNEREFHSILQPKVDFQNNSQIPYLKANSIFKNYLFKVKSLIWSKIELMRDFMVGPLTSKNEEYPI